MIPSAIYQTPVGPVLVRYHWLWKVRCDTLGRRIPSRSYPLRLEEFTVSRLDGAQAWTFPAETCPMDALKQWLACA